MGEFGLEEKAGKYLDKPVKHTCKISRKKNLFHFILSNILLHQPIHISMIK